jgi:hypothetical protein
MLKLKNDTWADEFAIALYFAMPAAALKHHPENPHIDPSRDWWTDEKDPPFSEILETVLTWQKPEGRRAKKRFFSGIRMLRLTREDRARDGH